MRIRNYIIALLIIYCGIIRSQERDLHFKQLTVNDGLQSNFIANITQDSDGFMWFASDNVLSRYDGYSFLVIENSLSDSNSISNGIITSMVEDNQHNLWIGTTKGLNCLDLKTYKYKGIFRSHEEMQTSVLSLYFDQKHNRLWVGCDNDGIYTYNIKSGKINQKYTHNPQDTNSLMHNSVRAIYKDNEENFWFATKAGLDKLHTATGTISHYLKGFMFRTILNDSKGRLWAGDENNGLWCSQSTSNPEFSLVTDIPDISQDIPSEMLEDKSGNLWFGVRDKGIFYLKSGQDEWRNLLPDKYNPNSIRSSVPQDIYEDQNGRIWIGTFDAGVNFLDNHQKAFLHVQESFMPNGLMNEKIRAVYQDSEGDIWLGTRINGMLSKFNRENFTYQHYKHNPKNPYSISDENVLCITEDRPGYLWVGTYHGGLNLFEKETGKFTAFKHDPDNPNSISQNSVYSLLKADDGRLYIGTMYKGLDIYDPKKNKFKNYRSSSNPRSLSHNHVRGYLYQDRQKNIWVGTLGGLNLYNPATDDFTRFLNDPQDSTSISDDRILGIYEDKQGNLWICTNGGLNLMNRKNNTFKAYTTEDGLPTNTVFGALEDNHGNLWLSTAVGISKFNPETKTFKNYIAGDDFEGNEIHIYGKLHNGEMIFGGNDGFTLFHPDNIVDNSVIPPVVITDFKIFNQSVKVGGEDPVLKNHISHTKEITLNHSQSVFTFDFVALNYTSPEKNQYAYIMEGFEKNWNYVGTQRNATYTNLNPGEYTFRVKASNNDGVWNEEGTFVNITILPPWWKTLWFRISAVLLIISGAISFYLMRINQIEKQKKSLAIEVENRTKELKLANEQLNEQKKSIEKSFNNIKTLSEFGHQLTSSLKLSDIDQMIHKYINNLMESDTIGLGIYNEKKQRLDFKSLTENGVHVDSYSSALTDNTSCGAWCFNNQKIIFSNDFQKEYHKYIEKLNPRTSQTPASIIYYPLTNNKKKLGVITVQSYKEDAYTDYEKAIIQTLASYICVALDNANAYQEIAEKNEALIVQTEHLNEVNEVLEERQQRIEAQAEEIAANVEELNNKNIKLNELVTTKDKFFSIIAHDLKNPFNIILGMGDILLTRYHKYDDSKRLDLINNIQGSAKKIYALLENLLHWSRSQMGTIDFEPDNINIYDTAQSVFELVSDQALEKGLELKNELVDPTYVFADQNMINAVLRNLVTNALKYTEQGTITINAITENNHVVVSVKDTGTGIDEQEQQKIFNLVSNRSKRGTNGETGTGLGLILCKDFVEKNNGKIWVESELEKGTTFFVSLPKHQN